MSQDNQNNEQGINISEKAKKALEQQVNKVIRELSILGDLGIKHRGEVQDEIVEKIFEHVKKKTATAKKQFKVVDLQDEFKID